MRDDLQAPRDAIAPVEILFIVGAQRSGTTVVHRLCQDLLSYSGATEGHIWQSVKALDGHFLRVSAELSRDPGGSANFLLNKIGHSRLLSAYVGGLLDLQSNLFGNRSFVDKTPGSEMIAALPIIKSLVPNAKFIFLKRRGIENVMSQLRRFHGRSFEAACLTWSRPMEAWLNVRDRLRPNFIEIDQRDLQQASLQVGLRVTEFLKRGDPTEVARYLADHFPEKTAAGAFETYVSLQDTGWSADQAQLFFDICGNPMRDHGYRMDQGTGEVASGASIDLVAATQKRQWEIEVSNQWLDVRGPGLRLHPSALKEPAATLRLCKCLPPGRYAFDAEIIVFDERCSPHSIVMSVLDGQGVEWAINVSGRDLGRLVWHLPSIEVADLADVRFRVILDPKAVDCTFAATQMVSAVFTRVDDSEAHATPAVTAQAGTANG